MENGKLLFVCADVVGQAVRRTIKPKGLNNHPPTVICNGEWLWLWGGVECLSG